MDYRILGPLEVVRDAMNVGLGGPRQQAVLVVLLLHCNEVMPTDRLIDAVWGDAAPTDAANTLHGYVFHLRKALEPGRPRGAAAQVLVSESGGYRLTVDPDHIDAARFERMADHGRRCLAAGDAHGAVASITSALDLWRGDPLTGFEDLPFAVVEAARLEERRLDATEDRIEAMLAIGEHRGAIAELEPLVDRNPWRERLSELKMTALYRSGRQAEALDEYQRVRGAMIDELGLEPGPGLRALESRILAHDPTLDAPRPEDTGPAVGGNLPHPATTFVGREEDSARLVESLDGSRLVTVIGPGGVGKTRLAVEVAHRLREQFEEVWLVDLSSIADPDLVVGRVATVVGVGEEHQRSTLQALVERLSVASTLLVIDNCEHVIEAAARLCTELVSGCENLTLVTTTREALAIDGERLLALGPMELPPTDRAGSEESARESPAVRLFVDRALAVRRDLDADAEMASIVTICRALDGVPLALELAAARLRSMTITDLADRIEDRFRLLTGGSRTRVSRQRTLEATVAWSHDLLDELERVVLARLSVFAGGFGLSAAESVVAFAPVERFDVVDLVGQLVDKSLVVLEPAEGRYRMLDTLRQFASDRLPDAEHDECRLRHARFFGSFMAEQARGLGGGGDEAVVREVDVESANVRAALRWAVDADQPDLALPLAARLAPWWEIRGLLSEGREQLETVLTLPGGPALDRHRVELGIGFIARRQGDHETAVRFSERAVKGFRGLGERTDLVHALGRMAWVALGAGEHEYAIELANEGLEMAVELDDPALPPWMHLGLGHAAHRLGQLDEAARELALARSGFEAIENAAGRGRALFHQALLAVDRDDLTAAADAAGESLRVMQQGGDVNGTLISVEAAARVAAAAGDHATAIRLVESVVVRRREMGARDDATGVLGPDGRGALAAGELSAAQLEEAIRSGRQLSLAEAVETARGFCVALARGSGPAPGSSRSPSSGG